MRPLSILILSDDRPGHYHLAEGVAAAIGRRVAIEARKHAIRRRKAAPNRVLALGLKLGVPPNAILKAGYGASPLVLGDADVVISAGGDTLAANVAAARALGALNIFCGTLRHLPPEAFGLIVSSYARHARLPRHLVTLKPSGIDPDLLPRRVEPCRSEAGRPPRLAGLLVGGPSGLFHWRDQEWERLAMFLLESHHRFGIRWLVSTSRRTPDAVGNRLQALAQEAAGPIAELIDFRVAGPGTLPRLFASVEAILATEDSSTMLSEAVCARLPVVGIAPERHGFKDEEAEYRALMVNEDWCRSVPLADLTPAGFVKALGEVRPLRENHLDRLANALAERLPELFRQRA